LETDGVIFVCRDFLLVQPCSALGASRETGWDRMGCVARRRHPFIDPATDGHDRQQGREDVRTRRGCRGARARNPRDLGRGRARRRGRRRGPVQEGRQEGATRVPDDPARIVVSPPDRRAESPRDPASRGRGVTRTRDRAAHLDVIERPPAPRAGSRTRDDPRARPARPPPPRPERRVRRKRSRRAGTRDTSRHPPGALSRHRPPAPRSRSRARDPDPSRPLFRDPR